MVVLPESRGRGLLVHSDLDSGLYRDMAGTWAYPMMSQGPLSSFFCLILPAGRKLVKEGRVRHGLTHAACKRRFFSGQEDWNRHDLACESMFLVRF